MRKSLYAIAASLMALSAMGQGDTL
ncbi:MAG: hypothetical protein RLZZ155_543, partial [Bacteroidota bacterium]